MGESAVKVLKREKSHSILRPRQSGGGGGGALKTDINKRGTPWRGVSSNTEPPRVSHRRFRGTSMRKMSLAYFFF